MVKVLVVFYSTYGHIYQMAQSVAEGAREVEGVEVDLQRVAETLPQEVLEKMGAIEAQKAFSDIPIANPKEFGNYDAVIIGCPTRFGLPPAQMKAYLDALGGVWVSGSTVGKVGSVFTSSNTQHGGQESTILAIHNVLYHLGMIVVGLPFQLINPLMDGETVNGGTPYGASTIAGPNGARFPSDKELQMAKAQGAHVARIAKKLATGKV
jgi:NAD(P)H dehydrogenase (quinone)